MLPMTHLQLISTIPRLPGFSATDNLMRKLKINLYISCKVQVELVANQYLIDERLNDLVPQHIRPPCPSILYH